MRNILLALLLNIVVFADGYRDFATAMSYETNYETALKRAKAENKNLMVLMVTNYCPWCSKFEKRTLMDANIDKTIKAKYIPLIINKDEKNFPPFLNVPVVPTTFFIDPSSEESFHESVGFSNKIDFANLLEALK